MALTETLAQIARLATQMSAMANSGIASVNDNFLDDVYRRLQQAMDRYVIERNAAGPSPPPGI